MALTLDGTTTLPMMGGGLGTGSGVGLGAVGGGVAGLLLGGLLGSNGNGLFGGGNNNASNAQFEAIQTQISGLQGQMNSAGMHSEINELENQLSAANIANLQGIAANALAYTNGNAAIQTSLANGNFTTLNSINGLGRDITAANTQALINTIQNFNTVNSNITNTSNQIIAGQNAIASQMASCCCEIKGTIMAEGAATRALINDLNVQSLRDQLSAANNKVSNNEQNQYLLSTILTHIKPTSVTVA